MITLNEDFEQAYYSRTSDYLNLATEYGEIINQYQDKIVSLQQENKRLKREIWNLKKRKEDGNKTTMQKIRIKIKCSFVLKAQQNRKNILNLLAKIRGISRQELLTQVVEHFIDNNLQLIQNYKNEFEELNNRTSKKIKNARRIK
jgi:methyl coenzyme M reductase subunit D